MLRSKKPDTVKEKTVRIVNAHRSTELIHSAGTDEQSSAVTGLHVLPDGPRYLFDAFKARSKGDRFFVIGASDECDIRIEHPSISAIHCAIVRRHSHVHVNDMGSKNGVWMGGRRVQSCELHDGSVFTIGRVTIATIGQENDDQSIMIAASTLSEFIRKAVARYGTIHAAAEGLDVPYSTLRGWIAKMNEHKQGKESP